MTGKEMRKKGRKKIGRWGAVCIMLIMLPLLLSGCHRVTAEGLIKAAAQNAGKAASFKGTVGMHVTMGLKQSGVSLNVKMGADMDIEATKKPQDYYMKGTVSISDAASMDMERYGMENPDGSIVTYTKVGDSWSKSEPDDSKKEEGSMLKIGNLLQEGAKPVLQKKLEKYNGKDVFVIKTTLDDFEKAEAAFKDIWSTSTGDVDLSKVKADVVIKIYKKDCLPASISIKMKADKGNAPALGNGKTKSQLDALSFTMKFKEYDTIDKIELPKAVESAAEGSGDSIDPFLGGIGDGDDSDEGPDNGSDEGTKETEPSIPKDENGNYHITDLNNKKKVTIVPPANMEMDDYSDGHSASFYTSQGESFLSAHYKVMELSKYYTEQDMIESIKDDKKYYESKPDYSDVKLTDLKTVKDGDNEIKYMTLTYRIKDGEYQSNCYAWHTTKDGYALECDISQSAQEQSGTAIDDKRIMGLASCIKE